MGTSETEPGASRNTFGGTLLFAAGCFIGTVIGVVSTHITPNTEDPDLIFYRTVREIIEEEYVQPIDREELLTAAVEGAVSHLDPYSRFYTGEPLARVEHDTRGTFQGIGAIFSSPMQAGRVLFPLPGSPAEKAGVHVGDQVLSFDGQALSELDEGGFAALLGNLTAETVTIEVQRLGGQTERLELTPDKVLDPTVRHLDQLEPSVGYLAITSFSRQTPDEFDRAVAELRAAGAESLIIDLRGNPGGVLRAATDIANRFINAGPLVITESRLGHEETLADPERATLLGMPLAVLVDSGSASASEVLAGALQDDRRAALVGTATYGKGTIQTLTPLIGPDSILKITTGFYATPAGRSIDRFYRTDGGSAIWPDVEVALDKKDRAHVHAWLADYSAPLALAASVEALELELGRTPGPRVPRDAQIEAALALLVEGS